MNQSHRNTPVAMMVSLIVLGIAAVALAFWLIDQPRELPASGLLFAVFLGVWFVCDTGAQLLYLRRRDLKQATDFRQLASPSRGALQHAGITTLTRLLQPTAREILKLHGVGPKSLPVLRQALKDAGPAYAEAVNKR